MWHLGPLPLRAYALAILAGIAAPLWLTPGAGSSAAGEPDTVLEIAFWAVPFGIVGGRIYHVLSSPDAYFGPGGDPVSALYIWQGGLGIWGAVAFGAVGAWIGCRRQGVRLAPWADALAPGLLVAQAIGRLGNWFNQELFGAPTTRAVGPARSTRPAPRSPPASTPGTLFHPTFLYEMLWNLAGAALLIWLDRRYRLGHGRVFWLYVLLLHDRPAVDRDAPHRPRRAGPRPAPQRLDLHRGGARRADILRRARPPPPGARDEPAARLPGPGPRSAKKPQTPTS